MNGHMSSQPNQFGYKNQNSAFNYSQSNNTYPWWCWLIIGLLIVLSISGVIVGLSSLAFKSKNNEK